MYARATPQPSTARARRLGYSWFAAPRPRPAGRQVARWRRAVRNLAIGAAALGLLFLLFTSHALGDTPPGPPQVVVVKPGQTVWSIAESRYPNQDPRQTVDEIDRANHLRGGVVYPGERLRLPAA